MDRNEIKSKILKGFTIALPILLVAILAMLIVVAMDLAKDNSVPVINGNVDDGTTTTTTSTTTSSENGGGDVGDDPAPDPSSEGLSFISNGDGTCSLDGLGECNDSFIIIPRAVSYTHLTLPTMAVV